MLAAVSLPFKGRQLHSVGDEAGLVSKVIPPHSLTMLGAGPYLGTQGGGPATAEGVLEHLPRATILHLACHGQQDMNDPLESGFLMEDKKLTVARLMELNLSSAFLAFLSACETAKGDANQPDQAIHLAATMLYAGFKSVVGTMWYVPGSQAAWVSAITDCVHIGQ